MTADEAKREMRRLTLLRDQGSLSIADYRQSRALLLDGLVGLDAHAGGAEPTRPYGRSWRSGRSSASATSAGLATMPGPRKGAPWRFKIAFLSAGAVLALVALGWYLRRGM